MNVYFCLRYSGYLKSVISQSLGLKPETCKLFFGGIEKQDEESLQLAGLKDNSEVLLVESVCEQVPEEVQETPVASKGEGAVAEARKDVDKLEQQVYLIYILKYTFSSLFFFIHPWLCLVTA